MIIEFSARHECGCRVSFGAVDPHCAMEPCPEHAARLVTASPEAKQLLHKAFNDLSALALSASLLQEDLRKAITQGVIDQGSIAERVQDSKRDAQ